MWYALILFVVFISWPSDAFVVVMLVLIDFSRSLSAHRWNIFKSIWLRRTGYQNRDA